MFTYPIAFFKSAASAGWTPAELFASSEEGAWYDPSDLSTLFQDATATTPAGVGDPVRYIADKSGNGNHAIAPNDTTRPVLRQSGSLYYLEFDGVDDYLSLFAIPASTTVTIACGVDKQLSSAGLILPTSNTVNFSFAFQSGSSASINSRCVSNSTYVNGSIITPTPTRDGLYTALDGASVLVGEITTNIFAEWPDPTAYLGSYPAAGFDIAGYFYNVVHILRTLTETERTNLEVYLANKAGVTL